MDGHLPLPMPPPLPFNPDSFVPALETLPVEPSPKPKNKIGPSLPSLCFSSSPPPPFSPVPTTQRNSFSSHHHHRNLCKLRPSARARHRRARLLLTSHARPTSAHAVWPRSPFTPPPPPSPPLLRSTWTSNPTTPITEGSRIHCSLCISTIRTLCSHTSPP